MSASRPVLASGIILAVALAWSMTAAAQSPAGGGDAAQDDPAQDRPVMVGGRPVAEAQGVWRSRGYGYLVKIDAERRQAVSRCRQLLLRGPGDSDGGATT